MAGQLRLADILLVNYGAHYLVRACLLRRCHLHKGLQSGWGAGLALLRPGLR